MQLIHLLSLHEDGLNFLPVVQLIFLEHLLELFLDGLEEFFILGKVGDVVSDLQPFFPRKFFDVMLRNKSDGHQILLEVVSINKNFRDLGVRFFVQQLQVLDLNHLAVSEPYRGPGLVDQFDVVGSGVQLHYHPRVVPVNIFIVARHPLHPVFALGLRLSSLVSIVIVAVFLLLIGILALRVLLR